MLKFFRRIRQNLLFKGKTGKYLKYAMGEILLVMIGILLALQVNNWNDQRVERIEEQLIMLNLKDDFEYNQRTLDSLIVYQTKSKETQLSLLNYTGKKTKPASEKEFNIKLEAAFQIGEFYPRSGALNDLINSGRLRIINNQRLRNLLASWESYVQNIEKREEYVTQNMVEIGNLIIKKGSWLNVDEVSTSKSITSNVFPVSGFDIDNRNLLNHIEFENLLEGEIVQLTLLTQSIERSLKLAEEILELLNKEIKY